MSDQDQYQRELDVIESVQDKGAVGKFFGYAKISGPGWLQGAITLGGGSLAGALYLGVVSGYGLLWVQPLAMICGIIMLSAIAYVTLSTGQRPLQAINTHLHPLLGWSWVVATIMANIVWIMPQFSLATGAIQENLFGGALISKDADVWLIIVVLFAFGLYVNYLYESGGKSAKLFDRIIKIMVGIIVLSFFAVVFSLISSGNLQLGKVFAGLIPDFSLLNSSSQTFAKDIAASSNPTFWNDYVVFTQKDKIFAAFGTAVGINMTFLLPYTLLKKKWGKKHRGLSMTDLSIGLFVPFFLATACVLIASAASFHGKTADVKPEDTYKVLATVPAVVDSVKGFEGLDADEKKNAVIKAIEGKSGEAEKAAVITAIQALPESDRTLAAMLHVRDDKALALTLSPFTGDVVARKVFGIGVLGMALSTIVILMLINGLAFEELFGGKGKSHDSKAGDQKKKAFAIGCLISGLAGCSYPFIWTSANKAALAIPTSVIGGSLIPIAYFTFFLLMNSRKVLGNARPEGGARILWNSLMAVATLIATAGSCWAIYSKDLGGVPVGKIGIGFLALLIVVGTISFLKNEKKA